MKQVNSVLRAKEEDDLMRTVLGGRQQAVVLLLHGKALKVLDLNTRLRAGPHAGLTPLHVACAKGVEGIVAALLAHRARTDVQAAGTGASPLHAAAEKGHEKVVRLLLSDKGKSHPSALTEEGATPLNLAAAGGHSATAAALVRAGASLVAKGEAGDTPFHVS